MGHATHAQNQGRRFAEAGREAARDIADTMQEKGATMQRAAVEAGGQAKEFVQDQMENLRDTAYDYVQRSRSAAEGYLEQGRERAGELEESLESRIRERPLQAVLVAAGLGLLLGMCWTSRK